MSGINSNSTENVPSGKVSDLIQRISVLEDVLCAAKEVLTLEEAAVFMGISRSTLYKMTHNNVIPFYRPNGKLIYFEKSELLAWMLRFYRKWQWVKSVHLDLVLFGGGGTQDSHLFNKINVQNEVY